MQNSTFRLDKIEAHSEEVSDDEDSDEDGDEVDDDDDDNEGDDIYEEGRKKKSIHSLLKALKENGKKMAIDDVEDYDEQVGDDVDGEDDLGWDVDTMDDDNTDIEDSSTPFKKRNIFSNYNKDIKTDKSDYYQELIEHLKKQYRYFKKQLDSATNYMKKRIKRLEGNIGFVNPAIKAVMDVAKKSVEQLENKQRFVKTVL